jgi:hypothetical protein
VLEINVSAHTSAPPEQVLAAAKDFSEQRAKVWTNLSAKRLEVHDSGEEFAEVTEGIWFIGLLWERSRYEWSQPGSVKQTVIDSNVLKPGSTWELRAVPRNGGSEVEMHLKRDFLGGPKGRMGSAINHLGGKRLWRSYLRRALAAVEKGSAQSQA